MNDRLPLPTIPSPCIGVCRLERDTGLCEGCLRTVGEIRDWLRGSDEQRLAILMQLKQRRRERGRTSAADLRPRRRALGPGQY
jgi:predicted Fe-S protein YdhL (DUF1289 family)